jgi:small subunit ribosomal protein S21
LLFFFETKRAPGVAFLFQEKNSNYFLKAAATIRGPRAVFKSYLSVNYTILLTIKTPAKHLFNKTIVEIKKKIITFAPLTRGGVYIMLIIPIKDGENIDRALKRYKRKFDKTGTVRQLRARQAFIKPSVTNRMKFQKAAYIQNMRDNLES